MSLRESSAFESSKNSGNLVLTFGCRPGATVPGKSTPPEFMMRNDNEVARAWTAEKDDKQSTQHQGKAASILGRPPQPFQLYVDESWAKIERIRQQLQILKDSGNDKEYKRVYN